MSASFLVRDWFRPGKPGVSAVQSVTFNDQLHLTQWYQQDCEPETVGSDINNDDDYVLSWSMISSCFTYLSPMYQNCHWYNIMGNISQNIQTISSVIMCNQTLIWGFYSKRLHFNTLEMFMHHLQRMWYFHCTTCEFKHITAILHVLKLAIKLCYLCRFQSHKWDTQWQWSEWS